VKTAAIPDSKPAEQPLLSPLEGYRLWSRVYDSQSNPMISLEERHLEPLVPDLRNRIAVDTGCGTGRWLQRLSVRRPSRLIGIDCSPEMLALAAARHPQADLFLASCESLPLRDQIADLVLVSFVIGYLDTLACFAAELRRIIAPGGRVLISDLHPETAASNGWQRSFSLQQQSFAVDSRFWSVADVVRALESEGFRLSLHLEPGFGDPERRLFEAAGKSEAFHALAGQPALSILVFETRGSATHESIALASTKPTSGAHHSGVAGPPSGNLPLLLRRGRIALSASEAITEDLRTDGSRLVPARQNVSPSVELELDGYLLLPGLVNAHDHLEFALFPRLGNRQYQNFREWAEEIYLPSEPPLRDHLSIPKSTRLWWGGLRNLLAGVITVCHHNPFLPEVFNEDFPVDVVRNFGWAHSLALEPDVKGRFAETPPGLPFIIHLAEGMDLPSARELQRLDSLCRISNRTVVVHGLGLTAQGRALLRRRAAALVWCPSSNLFLFGKTLSPDELAQIGRVALGTDSPLTAAGDMLDELRIARERGTSPSQLYELATSNPSDVLRLRDGEGTLRPGGIANLVAFRDSGLSPADTLIGSTFRDVALVVRRGRVQLVSDQLMPRIPAVLAHGLYPLLVKDHLCWVRAPLGHLFRDTVEALGCDLRLGGKEIRNASADFF
jgi:cytosine/adenosine deaminase-related metal-dependent hydrolase/SAM-dependent methyltransferase